MNIQKESVMHFLRIIVRLAFIGFFIALLILPGVINAQEKPRVIVMSDISKGEPDDAQSLIRFLLYANDFDIEGLLATTSIWRRQAGDEIAPQLIRERVEAYGKVRNNLLQHASGYPRAEDLLPLIKTGRLADGMKGVGDGKSTEASRHIVSAVDGDDPRPVWILAWGGTIDLAQALWDVEKARTPAEVGAFISKLRVYEIGGQDDTGAWIAKTFPDIFWIRSSMQFQGISQRVDGSSEYEEARGGDESIFSGGWVDKHIQNHGPLGALYPDARYKYEGDTPSFLHLIPTGLAGPEQISYGNWGGRFEIEKQKNPPAVEPVTTPEAYKPYRMYTGAADTWTYEEDIYNNVYAPLFRWRTAFQHDFVARMDWSISPAYDKANHNPIAAFRKDTTTQVIQLKAAPGDTVSLSAVGSYDPDGDRLSYAWDQYKEPGSYDFVIDIENSRTASAYIIAPEVDAPMTIHMILTVTDNGEPSLYSYRRIVVLVEPE
jgi:hypothetical protein